MLKHLHISNLAIIDHLDLEFGTGMTVFTGETGAGKSILIDALGLVLGDRADTNVKRSDKERVEIIAAFDISDIPDVAKLLQEQAIIVEDDELILRRIINTDGRSRALVNSSQVPLQTLRTLGNYLVDIHGQHEHQSLMNRKIQRNLLDNFAGHDKFLKDVRQAYSDWNISTNLLSQLTEDSKNHEATLALLKYQINELEELGPTDIEFHSLEEEHKRLANGSHLLNVIQSVTNLLSENEYSVESQMNQILRDLNEASKTDSSLVRIIELMDNALIQLSEGMDEVRAYEENLELDPGQLQLTENRLNALHDMSRKHKVQPQQLVEHLQGLHKRLDQMQHNQDTVEELLKQQGIALTQYFESAKKLHESRKKASKSLANAISKQLQQLGMPDGKLLIDVQKTDTERPQYDGTDQVEFMVSMNPGLDPQPLRKIASGGEMSRISLAIQVICKDEKTIPTLIFDEVDAGIGGSIAEIVGNLLNKLALNHQVFCVTHLPQVASQGNHHLQVQKSTSKKTTMTSVKELSMDEKVEEIARMLGGVKISDKTRAHALEMLNQESVN